MLNIKKGSPVGEPYFYALAAAPVVFAAATAVVGGVVEITAADAVTVAAAAEQDQQDDDPPAVIATETVVIHKEYLQILIGGDAAHSKIFHSHKKVRPVAADISCPTASGTPRRRPLHSV